MPSIQAANPPTHRPEKPIVLNGRAVGRTRVTGVERWAEGVIPRLLALNPGRYVTVAPPRGFKHRAGQAWEQFVLPVRARGLKAEVLFSPANLAPYLWPRNVVVVHDAAVLRVGEFYSPAYRAWHVAMGMTIARRALAVITVSSFSRSELIELAGLDPDRVSVIPGGVDHRFRPDADAERVASLHGLQRPYVLTVGTDDRRKNLTILGEASSRLDKRGLDLVWAGTTKSHIPTAFVSNEVRRLGYVAEADLPGLYAGARAFVLPSLYEGFGLPCIEAMASGTPVVASNRAALPETCGGAALLVDPTDGGVVAEAVVRAATDESVHADLRERGINRAAAVSWDRTAKLVDALLTRLGERS